MTDANKDSKEKEEKTIHLVGIQRIGKNDYTLRNFVYHIGTYIRNELVKIAKLESIEQPAPSPVREVPIYSRQEHKSELFLKHFNEWFNEYFSRHLPGIRAENRDLTNVINSSDLDRINVVLDQFDRIESQEKSFGSIGIKYIIEELILEDHKNSLRLVSLLKPNYQDNLNTLFKTHYSIFRLSGDYTAKIGSILINGCGGK